MTDDKKVMSLDSSASVGESLEVTHIYTMSFADYQQRVKETSNGDFESKKDEIQSWIMGIHGEAGEITEIFKKHFYHGHELDIPKVKSEIGDLLWYLSALCDSVGVTLEEVAKINIKKLKNRYPDGFDIEKSINRDE